MFTVVVKCRNRRAANEDNGSGEDGPGQASGSPFRQRAPAGGDTFLSPQEGRFLFHVQVEQPRIVQCIVGRWARRLIGRWIQLLLRDGGTAFSRHQPRSVVVGESLSGTTITAFR